MRDCNAANERIKHRYFAFLKEAYGYNEKTIDEVAKALSRFETHSRGRDFARFHFEQAIAFKRSLVETPRQLTGKPLSKATSHKILSHLKRFFSWLARQRGFRSRLDSSDADYFNLSEKDVRIAQAQLPQAAPTLEQIHYVLSLMPSQSDIDKRNRAIVAFVQLTGARVAAIASMKLRHVKLEDSVVHQDARQVRTKFSKTFITAFFPVGGQALEILSDWVRFLRNELRWDDDDPLFPATNVTRGERRLFEACGVKRKHWNTTEPVRKIFRRAFEGVGLRYFNPHSFRDTLVEFAERICCTPEEFKACSQNFGHEKVMTTFLSYGTVSEKRQIEIVRELRARETRVVGDEARLLREFASFLRTRSSG
jgi:integrase